MLRSVLVLSMLALPALARADEKSDARLDALEMKLQALLKEIQSLKGDKAAPAGKTEKRDVTLRLVDPKSAGKVVVGEKGVPKVVQVGEDGKLTDLDLEKLMKQRAEALDKLKRATELDMEKLKKAATDELAKLKAGDLKDLHIDKLKQLGVEQLDKLKSLDADMLKKLTADDVAKLKKEVLAQADKAKAAAMAEAEKAKDMAMAARKKALVEAEQAKKAQPSVATPSGTYRLTVSPDGVARTVVSDSGTVHLTRVTYTLSGEQARALNDFLKAFVKAQVLETKVEGDRLVVTTTPDVQSTIGQVVSLMSGKSANASSGALRGRVITELVKPPAVKVPATSEPVKPPKALKPAKPPKDDDDE